jgi:hypothetical protein
MVDKKKRSFVWYKIIVFYIGLLINTNMTLRDRRCPMIFDSPFYIIQAICIAFFTIEFLFRLVSCPSYWKFIKSILNWIDLLAIGKYFGNSQERP